MKLFTIFALVALLFATAQASSYKCPCRCTTTSIAKWQCKKSIYKGCKLIPCKRHHRTGLSCCEPPAPTSSPSAAPSTTASATPSMSAVPSMSSTPSATPSPSMSSTPSATPTPSMSSVPSMSSTPSAVPSPSMSSAPTVSPLPSSKPSCPCVCRRGIYGKKAAAKECKALHGHCKVTTCGYSRFSCCKY